MSNSIPMDLALVVRLTLTGPVSTTEFASWFERPYNLALLDDVWFDYIEYTWGGRWYIRARTQQTPLW